LPGALLLRAAADLLPELATAPVALLKEPPLLRFGALAGIGELSLRARPDLGDEPVQGHEAA
ncbi:MAG: hypothetical protein ACREC5_08685, partial [Thermoplasmata archaeon]